MSQLDAAVVVLGITAILIFIILYMVGDGDD